MLRVADESCNFSVVLGLRAAGHDVLAITEAMSGADDEQVIALANAQRRLLLTEDKDFGQLVFAAPKQNSGVPLFATRPSLAQASLKMS